MLWHLVLQKSPAALKLDFELEIEYYLPPTVVVPSVLTFPVLSTNVNNSAKLCCFRAVPRKAYPVPMPGQVLLQSSSPKVPILDQLLGLWALIKSATCNFSDKSSNTIGRKTEQQWQFNGAVLHG